MLPETLEWKQGALKILDQRRLPERVEFLDCRRYEDVADAIRTLAVRGAPAIGIAAAYGVALAAAEDFSHVPDAIEELANTRPTAVNLFWALEKMRGKYRSAPIVDAPRQLLELAKQIHWDDVANNKKIGMAAQELLPARANVITYCNAGALATGGYGTALGVFRAARSAGKKLHIYVNETRPVLQGARLTAWELLQDRFDFTLICDNMSASLMQKKKIDAVVVGADRIAANGDVANKIGTYMLAVLAHHHNVPFYVAAPTSTLDRDLPSGDRIPIEERDPREVRELPGGKIVSPDTPVWNPSFDVTPASLITAIITERGVHRKVDEKKA